MFSRIGIPILIYLLLAGCSCSEDFIVLRQVTGGIETNCYLLYGSTSKEATLIDVAGPVDSLVQRRERTEKLRQVRCTSDI